MEVQKTQRGLKQEMNKIEISGRISLEEQKPQRGLKLLIVAPHCKESKFRRAETPKGIETAY